jgi:hypothetical protein
MQLSIMTRATIVTILIATMITILIATIVTILIIVVIALAQRTTTRTLLIML